jgi:predicted kinase
MSDPECTASNLNLASEKRIRLIRPSVVVLCGPAACGKSTFAARHFRPTQVISSDHERSLVCDDETDQRHSGEAFALVNFIIEQRLSINHLCVVDSTALTPEARRTLLGLARKHGVTCVVFLFETPVETCIARDRARERSVGRLVIECQYGILERERNISSARALTRLSSCMKTTWTRFTLTYFPADTQTVEAHGNRPDSPGSVPVRRTQTAGPGRSPPRPRLDQAGSRPRFRRVPIGSKLRCAAVGG